MNEVAVIMQDIILSFIVGMSLWTMLTVRQIWEKLSSDDIGLVEINICGCDEDD